MQPFTGNRPEEGISEAIGEDLLSLLALLPIAAYVCDSDGRITWFNQRAVQLWGRAPRLNDPLDRFCGSLRLFDLEGSPITHDRCWMALALQGNRGYHGLDIVIERPDGARRTALSYAIPFRDATGIATGAMSLLVDITDRELVKRPRRRRTDFVGGAEDAA